MRFIVLIQAFKKQKQEEEEKRKQDAEGEEEKQILRSRLGLAGDGSLMVSQTLSLSCLMPARF